MYTGFGCGIGEGNRALERPGHKMESNSKMDLK